MATQRMQILISARDKAGKVIHGIRRKLKKLGNTAKKVGRSITGAFAKVGKSLFSFKSALIGAAGIAGIGYLMKQSMNATDEMAKMSRAIGVSVGDLQRLRHAADLGGLGAAQLDKAVQKLAVNMGDMSRGVGLAKDVFEKYGISVTDSNGKLRPVVAVMKEVADITAGLTNKTEKADMVYKLFGARGAKMINMLNGGSVAMQTAMDQADKLGFVMNDKVVAGVEKANDAFNNMSKAMGGVFDKLSASLAPALEKFGNYWATWWGTFSTTIQPAFDWINVNLQSMATNFGGAETSGRAWGETVRDWLIKVTENIRHFFTEMKNGKTDWQRFKEDAKSAFEKVKEFGRDVLVIIRAIGSAIRTASAKFEAFSRARERGKGVAYSVGAFLGASAPTATRASGGGVMANQPYLVGERGAETFTPTTSGKVSPNAGGSTNVTNIYTNATAHGINNALGARADNVSRGARVGMNIARATGMGGYGNLSMARAR